MLQQVAKLLRERSREADWVARWGGEEFLLLMPDSELAQAVGFIERLRAQIEASDFRIEGQQLCITTSAGIASCRLDQDSQDEVVNRADRALYAAKNAGRNRVCTEADVL